MFGLLGFVGVDAREVGGVDHGCHVNHWMNIPPLMPFVWKFQEGWGVTVTTPEV